MSMQRRREWRQRFESADTTIQRWYAQALKNMPQHVPPIDPTPEALSASETAAATVNVEWLAWMLSFAYCEGALSSAHPEIDLMNLMRGNE